MNATVLRLDAAEPPALRRSTVRLWMLLAGAFGLLFALTAARTIGWQDSGHFVLRVVTGELDNHYGLALVHPLHYWLAAGAVWALPLEPPFAIALVSALCGAITVANVFGILLTLIGRAGPAVLAAVALGLAHTFWRHATLPECYTVTTALLTAELWCLVLLVRTGQGRWLLGMMLASGLGWANHNMALLTLPIVGLAALDACWRRGGWAGAGLLAAGAAVWVLGSLPYSSLIAMEMARTGDVIATLRSALFGTRFASNVLNPVPGIRTLAISTAFTLLSFPNLFLPAAAYGLWGARRIGVPGRLHATLLGALGIHLLFVIRYDVIDQHTFFLPLYTLLAIFAGIGFASLARWKAPIRRDVVRVMVVLLALTPLLYAAAPELARQTDVLAPFARNKPYRDDYRYLLWPWAMMDVSAERMSRHAMELAGDAGLVVGEDSMGLFALKYQRWRMQREAVQIVPELEAEQAREALEQGRPIVLVPQTVERPSTPAPRGHWQREGDLYRLADD